MTHDASKALNSIQPGRVYYMLPGETPGEAMMRVNAAPFPDPDAAGEVECAEGRAALAIEKFEADMADFIADLTPIADARFLEVARCSFEQSFRLLRLAVFP